MAAYRYVADVSRTACTHTTLTLRPFDAYGMVYARWNFPYIPLLTPECTGVVESPTAYIIGIPSALSGCLQELEVSNRFVVSEMHAQHAHAHLYAFRLRAHVLYCMVCSVYDARRRVRSGALKDVFVIDADEGTAVHRRLPGAGRAMEPLRLPADEEHSLRQALRYIFGYAYVRVPRNRGGWALSLAPHIFTPVSLQKDGGCTPVSYS